MARVTIETMEGKDLSPLAFARKLKDAKRIEEALTVYGIDYCVELGEYSNLMSVIFGSRRTGVYFFVQTHSLVGGREILEKNRLKSCIITEDDERNDF